jgi:hypothetical protein
MERAFRFRTAGLVFYVTTALFLFSSPTFRDAAVHAISSPATTAPTQVLVAVIGASLLLFTSDAIGYLFGSVFNFVFNHFGGYSGLYSRRLANATFRDTLIEQLGNLKNPPKNFRSHKKFIASLSEYRHDQLLVYFHWHIGDVPSSLDDWLERRHTAFFTAWITLMGAGGATLLSLALFCSLGLAPSSLTWMILVGTFAIAFVLVSNANFAMEDALRVIDLRLAGSLDPRIDELRRKVDPNARKGK